MLIISVAYAFNPHLYKLRFDPDAETVKVTPDEFGKLIKTEMAKWGKVVREASIKAE